MKKNVAVSLLPLTLTLAACSNFAQPTPTPTLPPTQTALPTPTLAPTEILLPPTATPEISSTITPEGEPASAWAGIPIMPGAIAGDGDEESYVFTIRATPQQIRKYYESELGKLGWQSLVEGGDSLTLTFTQAGSATFTVNIIAKGEESLVLLAK